MAMPTFADPANLMVEDGRLILPEGITALPLLQMAYRGQVQLTPQQMRAAIEALPFEVPKLSATAVASMDGKTFAEAVGLDLVKPGVGVDLFNLLDQLVSWIAGEEIGAVMFFAPHLEGGFDLCRAWARSFLIDNPIVLHERSERVRYGRDPAGKARCTSGLDEPTPVEKATVGSEAAVSDAGEFYVELFAKVVVAVRAVEPALLEVNHHEPAEKDWVLNVQRMVGCDDDLASHALPGFLVLASNSLGIAPGDVKEHLD
jgi:hypothetical protein